MAELRIVILVLAVLLAGCEHATFETEQSSAGEILSAQSLHVYSVDEVVSLQNTFQIPDSFEVVHAVEALSITYQTADAHGREIRASGALLLPLDVDSLPILSMQHGTETKYDRVASVSPLNSNEGIAGLLTASIGYVTCIADYPGFGVSRTPHPYFHAKSLARPAIDLILATKTYCRGRGIALDGQLFLTGYSEGGYVTLAVQREIEAVNPLELRLVAVAPMAGLYDLTGTFNYLLGQSTYRWPAYVSFFFYAYDNLYGWNRLQEIFNSPYDRMVPSLFDGSKTFAEINGQLPTSVPALINQQFIGRYLAGDESEIGAALAENTLLGWTPVAPIRFFHGDSDDVAPIQNAITAVESFTANGATDVRLLTIPGGNHATSGVPSVVGAISWFESIRRSDEPQSRTVVAAKDGSP